MCDILHVELIEGRHLPVGDGFIALTAAGNQVFKSKVAKCTKNPKWMQLFTFHIFANTNSQPVCATVGADETAGGDDEKDDDNSHHQTRPSRSARRKALTSFDVNSHPLAIRVELFDYSRFSNGKWMGGAIADLSKCVPYPRKGKSVTMSLKLEHVPRAEIVLKLTPWFDVEEFLRRAMCMCSLRKNLAGTDKNADQSTESEPAHEKLLADLGNFVDNSWQSKYHISQRLGHGGEGTVFMADVLTDESSDELSSASSFSSISKAPSVAIKITKTYECNPNGDVEPLKDALSIMQELEFLKSVKHPNCIEHLGGFIEKKLEDNVMQIRAFTVMEFFPGDNMERLLRKYQRSNERVSRHLVFQWTLEVCGALHYLHSKSIVHRDFKTDNILVQETILEKESCKTSQDRRHDRSWSAIFSDLDVTTVEELDDDSDENDSGDDDEPDSDSLGTSMSAYDSSELLAPKVSLKLVDFGITNVLGDVLISGAVGTNQYAAPEQWNSQRRYDESADIWSLGVVLYQLLTGKVVTELPDFRHAIEKDSHFLNKDLGSVQSSCTQFWKMFEVIQWCLKIDPSERPTAKEIIDYLRCGPERMYLRRHGSSGLIRPELTASLFPSEASHKFWESSFGQRDRVKWIEWRDAYLKFMNWSRLTKDQARGLKKFLLGDSADGVVSIASFNWAILSAGFPLDTNLLEQIEQDLEFVTDSPDTESEMTRSSSLDSISSPSTASFSEDVQSQRDKYLRMILNHDRLFVDPISQTSLKVDEHAVPVEVVVGRDLDQLLNSEFDMDDEQERVIRFQRLGLKKGAAPDPSVSEGETKQICNPIDMVFNSQSHVLILGPAASGKSVLMKLLLQQAAKRAKEDAQNPIPLFVPIATLSLLLQNEANVQSLSPEMLLIRASAGSIIQNTSNLKYPSSMEHYLLTQIHENHHVLFLLDGLDEAGLMKPKVESLIGELRILFNESKQSRIFVTSRVTGFTNTGGAHNPFDGFRAVKIMPLSFEMQKQIAERRGISPQSPFITMLSRSRLQELAKNPLLLSLMISEFKTRGNLPEQRADLYGLAIDTIIKTFFTKMSSLHHNNLSGDARKEKHNLERFLIDLAETLHSTKRRDFRSSDIEKEAHLRTQWLQIRPYIDLGQLPLVIMMSGIYRFSHLSFQEYFVAIRWADSSRQSAIRTVARDQLKARFVRIFSHKRQTPDSPSADAKRHYPLSENIRSLVLDPWYTETFLLLSSKMEKPQFKEFLEFLAQLFANSKPGVLDALVGKLVMERPVAELLAKEYLALAQKVEGGRGFRTLLEGLTHSSPLLRSMSTDRLATLCRYEHTREEVVNHLLQRIFSLSKAGSCLITRTITDSAQHAAVDLPQMKIAADALAQFASKTGYSHIVFSKVLQSSSTFTMDELSIVRDLFQRLIRSSLDQLRGDTQLASQLYKLMESREPGAATIYASLIASLLEVEDTTSVQRICAVLRSPDPTLRATVIQAVPHYAISTEQLVQFISDSSEEVSTVARIALESQVRADISRVDVDALSTGLCEIARNGADHSRKNAIKALALFAETAFHSSLRQIVRELVPILVNDTAAVEIRQASSCSLVVLMPHVTDDKKMVMSAMLKEITSTESPEQRQIALDVLLSCGQEGTDALVNSGIVSPHPLNPIFDDVQIVCHIPPHLFAPDDLLLIVSKMSDVLVSWISSFQRRRRPSTILYAIETLIRMTMPAHCEMVGPNVVSFIGSTVLWSRASTWFSTADKFQETLRAAVRLLRRIETMQQQQQSPPPKSLRVQAAEQILEMLTSDELAANVDPTVGIRILPDVIADLLEGEREFACGHLVETLHSRWNLFTTVVESTLRQCISRWSLHVDELTAHTTLTTATIRTLDNICRILNANQTSGCTSCSCTSIVSELVSILESNIFWEADQTLTKAATHLKYKIVARMMQVHEIIEGVAHAMSTDIAEVCQAAITALQHDSRFDSPDVERLVRCLDRQQRTSSSATGALPGVFEALLKHVRLRRQSEPSFTFTPSQIDLLQRCKTLESTFLLMELMST